MGNCCRKKNGHSHHPSAPRANGHSQTRKSGSAAGGGGKDSKENEQPTIQELCAQMENINSANTALEFRIAILHEQYTQTGKLPPDLQVAVANHQRNCDMSKQLSRKLNVALARQHEAPASPRGDSEASHLLAHPISSSDIVSVNGCLHAREEDDEEEEEEEDGVVGSLPRNREGAAAHARRSIHCLSPEAMLQYAAVIAKKSVPASDEKVPPPQPVQFPAPVHQQLMYQPVPQSVYDQHQILGLSTFTAPPLLPSDTHGNAPSLNGECESVTS